MNIKNKFIWPGLWYLFSMSFFFSSPELQKPPKTLMYLAQIECIYGGFSLQNLLGHLRKRLAAFIMLSVFIMQGMC